MREFLMRNDLQPRHIGDAIGVLTEPRFGITEGSYPDYSYWIEKVADQLGKNEKRAMMMYWGQNAVGTILYQRHRTEKLTVEIKNISVSPGAEGRHIASFMLRNVEHEATQNDFPGCNRILVDTKVSNRDMIGFLFDQGYTPIATADLYELGAGQDIVFEKNIMPSAVVLDR